MLNRTKEGLDGPVEGSNATVQGLDRAEEGLDRAEEGLDRAEEGLDRAEEALVRVVEEWNGVSHGLDAIVKFNILAAGSSRVCSGVMDSLGSSPAHAIRCRKRATLGPPFASSAFKPMDKAMGFVPESRLAKIKCDESAPRNLRELAEVHIAP